MMNNEGLLPANLNVTRTLTTVLFTRATNLATAAPEHQADVLNLLQRDFQVMQQLCRQYRGQVLKSIGESLLMTFSSGTNAVTCALKIQAELRQLAQETHNQFTLRHSIGMHLGEVLLSESDVMGNEVNLAMQLQAEVPDGEICISQPLYEVVKLNANLQVQSLGERILKGASNPLGLYRVLPESLVGVGGLAPPHTELADLKKPEPLRLQIAHSEIPKRSRIAQKLEQHSTINRIKRLLLFACRNHWESSPEVIQNLTCVELLTELQERVLTFESLQAVLDVAVSRLNKKTEYTESVQFLLQQVKSLYDDVRPELTTRYQQIARSLEAHSSADRIKKLLLWTIREHWERDPNVLQETKIATLLPELAIRAPSLDQLEIVLHRATQCLNKPAEYQAIADLIRQALASAYHQLQDLETFGAPAVGIPPTMIANSQSAQRSSANGKGPHTPPPLSTGSATTNSAIAAQGLRPTRTPLPQLLSSEQGFNLRYSLMQRVNTLRLKTLLYSVLHKPLSFGDRSWSILQQESLDNLLNQIIRRYETLEELSQALYRVAVLPTAGDDCLQVMETLLRILETDLQLHAQPVPGS